MPLYLLAIDYKNLDGRKRKYYIILLLFRVMQIYPRVIRFVICKVNKLYTKISYSNTTDVSLQSYFGPNVWDFKHLGKIVNSSVECSAFLLEGEGDINFWLISDLVVNMPSLLYSIYLKNDPRGKMTPSSPLLLLSLAVRLILNYSRVIYKIIWNMITILFCK